LLSDLGTASEILKPSPAQYVRLVGGRDPELRALRVAYLHRKFGKVILEYQQRAGSGMHPIGGSLSLDPPVNVGRSGGNSKRDASWPAMMGLSKVQQHSNNEASRKCNLLTPHRRWLPSSMNRT
jgi:hypothetical protein